jgi:SPP1 family predicted phage head-tail adaptor
MKAGKLRHLVALYAPTDGIDSFGDNSGLAFTQVATVGASIEPLVGRELMYAQAMRSDVTHKVTMRYRSDINAKWQMTWNGRTFECGPTLNEDLRGVMMTISVTEIQSPQ